MTTADAPAPPRRVKTSLPPGFDAPPPGQLSTSLGWFSVGLGLAELLAPRDMAGLTGVRSSPTLLQLYGLRELACGVGILTSRAPGPWLWARVAGDALDLATLGAELAGAGRDRRDRLLASAAAVAGVTALDVKAARHHSRAAA